MTDPATISAVPQTGGDLGVELRGYELAKRVGQRWEQVMHFRPDWGGYQRAIREGKWFAERQPHNEFRVRPIVSLNPSAVETQATAAPEASTPEVDVPALTKQMDESDMLQADLGGEG